jgi:hypothetical protein
MASQVDVSHQASKHLLSIYRAPPYPHHLKGRGKSNVHPRTGHEGAVGEYRSTLTLASALDGVGDQRHASASLPQERPTTHCVGGWVGPRAGLDGLRKISPPPEFDLRTVKPVASRCADYAIPAHIHPSDLFYFIIGGIW